MNGVFAEKPIDEPDEICYNITNTSEDGADQAQLSHHCVAWRKEKRVCAMRSKKNLVIGFLLLFLESDFLGTVYYFPYFAGVAGIVMMILYAASKLKQNTSETSAVSFKTSEIQPTTKTQQTNAQSVSFSPEAQQLYQQLADQYTQIRQRLFRDADTDCRKKWIVASTSLNNGWKHSVIRTLWRCFKTKQSTTNI